MDFFFFSQNFHISFGIELLFLITKTLFETWPLVVSAV